MQGLEPNQHMRYPIPPADSRLMSGGRHKKEIKRRTKTGCLTCRKRRIKVRRTPFRDHVNRARALAVAVAVDAALSTITIAEVVSSLV